MEILIQAKKSAADPQMKAYAQAKLEKLTRHFDHILEARMELGTEKIKRLKMRPMSDDQAREQMDELGHTFFLFLNEDSQELNLLYRRHDGSLGLLEADLS